MTKYYIRGERFIHEEDLTHEFKGHKNLSVDELPKWTQATKWERGSRKAVSRNLCGFLNTGLGGTVYCGILDNGQVEGLSLTQYQRDHVAGSLDDLMSRYTPPVPKSRYLVCFVPVLSSKCTEEEREELCRVNTKDMADPEQRKREHILRSPDYCWCDLDCKVQKSCHLMPTYYVIEITISRWDCDNPENRGFGRHLNLHPHYADEDGRVYFRTHGRLIQYSLTEIASMTRYEAKIRVDAITQRLERKILQMKLAIAERNLDMEKSLEEREESYSAPES